MKLLLFWYFFGLGLCTNAQGKNPFQSIQYDKVILYDFENTGNKRDMLVDSNANYLQKMLKKVELDKSTIQQFNTKLGDKKSYGNVTAACFDPHCGLIYFLQNKVVCQITICLACNRLRSTIDIPAQHQGKQGTGKEVYYINDGLSKPFRKFINGVLKKNNFSNQTKPGSDFDN